MSTETNERDKAVEIYLYDLTAEKQKELIKAIGDDGNYYEVFPIVTLLFAERKKFDAE